MLLRAPVYNKTYTRSKIKNASRKNPCPVCRGTGCGLIDGGKVVLCWRESYGATKQTESGAWIHVMEENTSRPLYVAPPKKEMIISASTNTVYTAFLEVLTLRDSHYKHLSITRKLSDETIKKNQFKSIPTKTEARRICSKLGRRVNLEHVPGFFFEGEWRLNVNGNGFFVPYRDIHQSIQGMQVRLDAGEIRYLWLSSKDYDTGASPGAPIHYSRPDLVKNEIWITEGGLKAICISEYAKIPVVALGGVNAINYDNLFEKISNDLPFVQTVNICFDLDWQTNKHVRRALERITEVGRSKGYNILWEVWEDSTYKGFDDFLIHHADYFSKRS